MVSVFVALFVAGSLTLLVGIIWPRRVLPGQKPTRGRVLLVYGGLVVGSFIGVGLTAPKRVPSSAAETPMAAATAPDARKVPLAAAAPAPPASVAPGAAAAPRTVAAPVRAPAPPGPGVPPVPPPPAPPPAPPPPDPARISALERELEQAMKGKAWDRADAALSSLRELDPRNRMVAARGAEVATALRTQREDEERVRTVEEGIAEAQRIVADAGLCDTPLAISKAWEKVRLVRSGDRPYRKARQIVAKLEKCRRKVERELDDAVVGFMVQQRESWAEQYEAALLDQGMDVRVKLSGRHKNTVTIRFVLMSRPLVHQITKDGEFLGSLQRIGFEEVKFSDGYFESYVYELHPQAEVGAGKKTLVPMGIGSPLKL